MEVKERKILFLQRIIENLNRSDLDDLVQYDFALCHIGMRKMEF